METMEERNKRIVRLACLKNAVKVMPRGAKVEEVLLFAKKLEIGLDNWDSIVEVERLHTEGSN